MAYLLVDHQWNIDGNQQEHFIHFAEMALNTSGVEITSQIAIDFDPVYEFPVLHSITIHRGGLTTDRLNRTRMSVIQREKNLENLIYDGSKTLNIFLEDIRVGDIVEYSFSIKGANPAFDGHFAEQLKMCWTEPVERLNYRIIWPLTRPLYIKNYRTDFEPLKTFFDKYTEYTWSKEQIKELLTEKNIPDWYSPHPVVYLSDFSSWQDVVKWARPSYALTAVAPLQHKVLDSLQAAGQTEEEHILAALRFVQDEIRYLGIELGTRSHRPNDPEQVIRQRFGDCKDKSRLLVSLLRGMGINAAPALVNSYSGKKIKNGLPSPTAFNHVITRVQTNGKTYWLDPTLTYQRGNLDTLYMPNYEYALVISEDSSDIEQIASNATRLNKKEVVERIDVLPDENGEAGYRIWTNLENYYADSMRKELAETSLSELQQAYLNYTAAYFPNVHIADKMQVSDIAAVNRLTLIEHYAIPKIWSISEDKRYVLANFEPYLIHDNIRNFAASNRTMPYALPHPVRYKQNTKVVLGRDSNFNSEHIVVEDAAFRFVKNIGYKDDTLEIEYLYESLKDHVMPEDIETYLKNIHKVLDLSAYQIQKPNPALHYGEYTFDLQDMNWKLAATALLVFSGSTFLFWRFGYRYDPPFMVLADADRNLEGIKGWLILPGLALLLTPVRICWDSKDLWYTFSAQQWSILADQVNTAMLILIALEVLSNVLLVMAAIFLIILFFQRRYTFPRFFIIFLLSFLGLSTLDLLLWNFFSPSWPKPPEEMTRSLINQAIYAAVWITYFWKSKRVQATFIRRRKERESSLETTGSAEISAVERAS